MRVAVSGATGLLGSALARALGDDVVRLSRRYDEETAALDGADAVVHLGAETIFGRWTAAKKARIRESRVEGTALMARTLAGLSRPPRVLLCGSAVGYYGDRGDEVLDESSARGDGFLAEVVEAWEAAAAPARDAGIRVVFLRSGVVLSPDGGALAQMLTPFRLGIGGRIGKGTQWMSWIAIDDWVRAARFLLDAPLDGPVNLTSPEPVTNAELTKTLARVLSRPAVIPVPGFALSAALGSDAAHEMLLVSQRAKPKRLLDAGFAFEDARLEAALRAMMSTSSPSPS